MPRLIDADAFCDEMRNRQNECGKWRNETEDEDLKIRADATLSAFIECKLTLDKMPTIEPQHWIPCCERLPEEDGLYLITVKRKYVEGEYVSAARFADGVICYQYVGDIVAWMPLPEPYKGEEE